MEKQFIHYCIMEDGNERERWGEQLQEGGVTLFRLCLCVQMNCCPITTEAGINSLQETKGPFYWELCLDRIFLPLCWAGFHLQESSCFQPDLVTHTHTRTRLYSEFCFWTTVFIQTDGWLMLNPKKPQFLRREFELDRFNIGRYPSVILFSPLFVWKRLAQVQFSPNKTFSQGCAEVAEVKGGQTSVMAA